MLTNTKLDAPLVSVVIPTCNRLSLLQDAVRSVQSQTCTDWELLIVDDGSTDGTAEYLHMLASTDSRVRPILLEHLGNSTAMRAAGADAARGEWIAFLDSDDIWLEGKLKAQLSALEQHPSCGWSYTGYIHVGANGSGDAPGALPPPKPVSGWILEDLITYNAAAAMPTVIVLSSLFDEINGFDDQLELRSDYDFALRLAAQSEACAVMEELVKVRVHPGRTTNQFPVLGQLQENAVVFRKTGRAASTPRIRSICAQQCAAQYAHMARILGRDGRPLAASRALMRCVMTAPSSIAAWRSVAGQVARWLRLDELAHITPRHAHQRAGVAAAPPREDRSTV